MIHVGFAKYGVVYTADDVAVREFEAVAYQQYDAVEHDDAGNSPRQSATSEGKSQQRTYAVAQSQTRHDAEDTQVFEVEHGFAQRHIVIYKSAHRQAGPRNEQTYKEYNHGAT